MAAKMQITWEEVFEKSTMDFFIPKSSLLKYIEDGESVFLDVRYRMRPSERKLHMQKVLAMTEKNPNIRFYVLDDDQMPELRHLLGTSVAPGGRTGAPLHLRGRGRPAAGDPGLF